MKKFYGSEIYDILIKSGFEMDDAKDILRSIYSFYLEVSKEKSPIEEPDFNEGWNED